MGFRVNFRGAGAFLRGAWPLGCGEISHRKGRVEVVSAGERRWKWRGEDGEEGERMQVGDGENDSERGCPTAVFVRQVTVELGDCRPRGGEGKRAKLGGVNLLSRVCLSLLVQRSRADLLPSVHAVGRAQAQGEADGERHRRETHPIQQGVSGEASYLLPSTVQIKDQC